jgi:hypothetical protein
VDDGRVESSEAFRDLIATGAVQEPAEALRDWAVRKLSGCVPNARRTQVISRCLFCSFCSCFIQLCAIVAN